MLKYLKMFTLSVIVVGLLMVVATDSFAGGDAAAGKAVYDANCSPCHGADGNSPMAAMGVPNFANGDRLDVPLADRYKSVCDGKESTAGMGAPPMPPFCGTLSEADINNALAYEETLKK
jgi:cytochrome c oxidase cbb3-type subunit 3